MDRIKIDLTRHLDKTALIHYKRDKTSSEVKYKDLLKQILKVELILEGENLSRIESTTIGILCKKSPAAVSLVLAAIESDFAFCFLSKDNVSQELDLLGVKYFFSDEVLICNDFVTLRNSLDVLGRKIYLYKSSSSEQVRRFQDNDDPMNRICYTVTTSGTTGQRKIVRVTYNCISSNVVALQNIFCLDNDVIYSSAPCTFDVFALDLFLALHSGSALMIVDESLRYSDDSLAFMFPSKEAGEVTGVTFLQITPSLFQHFGLENIQNKILQRDSSLKYLVLGGEQFPSTKEVLSWQDWDGSSTKRVFNIYGTTEVSCWAMIHEVTRADLDSGEVPLGELLEGTSHAFSPDLNTNSGLEELVLTSQKRVCFVDDKKWDQELDGDHYFAQHTGDLVRRNNNKVYFYGRINDIIKKHGERVNLNTIEITASEIIQAVACIYMKKKIVLFVKTDDDHQVQVLTSFLKVKLKPSEVPDEIRRISFFPLSENGKVSKQQLKEIYKDLLKEDRERRLEAEESFLEAINQILNLKLGKTPSQNSDEPDGKRMRTDMDLTFKALGGTSFDALRISMKLEDQTGFSNGLLPKLLGEQHSIRDICHYLKDLKLTNGHQVESQRVISTRITSEVVVRFNLEKCVDSSPALIQIGNQSFVTVGSHSHKLITINATDLTTVSKAELADRVECEVAEMGQSALVGCYDGNLYSFDLLAGTINWKFDSKGMIKSKPLVVGELAIFGNYNYESNLWCLQRNESGEMKLKWKRMVGSRGILSSPMLVSNSSALICTLGGICELVDLEDGAAIWSKTFESPIFSSPLKVPGREEFLVAEVSKIVHCIDFSGNSVWNFKADGHIFSSFLFHQETEDEVKILFGCHDKKLRCLKYSFASRSAALEFSVELQSQIYGTPRLTSVNSEHFVISCTTNGFVNFVKLSNGEIEHSHKLPGEIFSTPVTKDRLLFVGCRDNFLYCLRF